MHTIYLKNGKSFISDSNTTIFEAARSNGIILEHSCLIARCRSCAVKVETGTTIDKLDDLALSIEEKSNNWTLTCNAVPISDLVLDIEDLGDIQVFKKKIVPAKIQTIKKLNNTVLEVSLRIPPNSKFAYNPGQYVNITKGQIKRSYSIANAYQEKGNLIFLIKKIENGLMSNYWFNKAKPNDFVRIEGPIGTFILRDTRAENIVFLATGTGIAPIKAILENLNLHCHKYQNKKFWIFNGARYERDLFWRPSELDAISHLKYIPVLSRETEYWNGEKGYVQEAVVKAGIDLKNAQVYACGSNNMIESAKKMFLENGLNIKDFFSDAFVSTN